MNKPPENWEQKKRLISSLILKVHQMDCDQLNQFLFVANCLIEGIQASELRLLECQHECERLRSQVQSLKESFAQITEKQIERSVS